MVLSEPDVVRLALALGAADVGGSLSAAEKALIGSAFHGESPGEWVWSIPS
jgi:hypothetical protein